MRALNCSHGPRHCHKEIEKSLKLRLVLLREPRAAMTGPGGRLLAYGEYLSGESMGCHG